MLLLYSPQCLEGGFSEDRKSTRLNSSHTVIYTLSLHDALPILADGPVDLPCGSTDYQRGSLDASSLFTAVPRRGILRRSEEHTSELQSHRDLHSFPTRRSSDLGRWSGGFTLWIDRLSTRITRCFFSIHRSA